MFADVHDYPHFEVGTIMGMPLARSLQKLTDVLVKSSKLKPGRHSDGGGLYLNVSDTGSKSWLFMWTKEGRRREMGLGPYPDVSLAKARAKATGCRELVAEGKDPIVERDRESAPTFGEEADTLIEAIKSEFRNPKHVAQWKMTLTVYAKALRPKAVDEIGTDDVLRILKPIWVTKPETASRVRGRIERVLDASKAKGHRSGENPARWRGHLDALLPKRKKLTRGHHAAMGYDGMPGFISELRESDAMSARALEFLILTASRSGEVLQAKWSEFDMTSRVWTVPADRMKAGREHRIPLTESAFRLIQRLHNYRINDYVFAGQKKDRPLSGLAMTMLMRRMKLGVYTVHGFRSAFRDWAGDRTSFPREIAEAALAHTIGDETERAYRRGDALAKRRRLMDAWEKFLGSTLASNVVKFQKV
ncbi:tyrosine-type recombinase/integrase [Rhizobium leguminosarum]|nr:site-specific integrase [Rhizobium leguminosarum]